MRPTVEKERRGGHCGCAAEPRPKSRSLWITAPTVGLLAILPKCPMCLMAYGGVFAIAGVSQAIVGPVVTALAVLGVIAVLAFAIRRRNLVFGIVGTLAIALIYWVDRRLGLPWGRWAGIALLCAASAYELLGPRLRGRKPLALLRAPK
ncbi:MAG: hypothetical protein HOW73_39020 [Polyangiaceae bacterium]|nr:hypothetical protein [Polyangiaceae bacterium]